MPHSKLIDTTSFRLQESQAEWFSFQHSHQVKGRSHPSHPNISLSYQHSQEMQVMPSGVYEKSAFWDEVYAERNRRPQMILSPEILFEAQELPAYCHCQALSSVHRRLDGKLPCYSECRGLLNCSIYELV